MQFLLNAIRKLMYNGSKANIYCTMWKGNGLNRGIRTILKIEEKNGQNPVAFVAIKANVAHVAKYLSDVFVGNV